MSMPWTFKNKLLELCRSLGDVEGEAVNLDMLGLIHHRLGNQTEAEKFLRQALRLQQSIRDKRSEGYTLTHMGWVLVAQQSYEAARQSFSRALTIRREVDEDGATAIDDLAGLTQIALALDDIVLAMKYATEILDWFEQGDAESRGVSDSGLLGLLSDLSSGVFIGTWSFSTGDKRFA